MEMCGLFRVVASQSTLPICHPRFRFPLRGGERKHFSSVKFMLSKYGRTSSRKNRPKISFAFLVFSLSAVGIPGSPVISAEKTLFDFETKSFYYLFVEFTKRK